MLYILFKNGESYSIPQEKYGKLNYDGKVVTILDPSENLVLMVNVDTLSYVQALETPPPAESLVIPDEEPEE